MIFYDNLIIKKNEKIMLMNLFNFRRKFIEQELYDILVDTKNSNLNRKKIIENLVKEKQILEERDVQKMDAFLKEADKNCSGRNMEVDTLCFMLTYQCNFKCSYCYERKMKKTLKSIGIKEVDRIDDFLEWYSKKYHVKKEILNITITGGESLLPSNIKVIQYISKIFPKAKISIKTNGVYLTEVFEKLPIDKIDNFCISLDGLEDIHMTRALGREDLEDRHLIYNKIIEGIKLSLKYKKKVYIATIIDRNTYKMIPDFIKYLEREEILQDENCEIAINATFDNYQPYCLDYKFNDLNDIYIMSKFFKEEMPLYLDNILLLPQIGRLKSAIERTWNEKVKYGVRVCKIENPYSMMFIPDGKVAFCDYTGSNEQVIGEFLPEMKFFEEKLLNISCRSIYKQQECEKCIYRMVCSTGCGKYQYFGGKQNCGIYKNEFIMDNLDVFML